MSETALSETETPKPTAPTWRRWGLLAVLVVVGGAAFAFGWVQRQLGPVAENGAATTPFEVEAGWGAAQVAGALEEAGLIRSARVFSLYLQLRGLDRSVGEGLYTLSPALGAVGVAERLAAGGQPRVSSLLIPEGFRAARVVRRLQNDANINIGPLVRRPGALRPAFVPPGAGLEGYLFPARYEVPDGSTPEEAVARMLTRFGRELTPAVRQNLRRLDLSVHEWVTLASIVQAEAGSHAEMPTIAGVFLNRLDRGMRLQSDPTVAYGLNKPLPELDAVAGDLRRDTPWNTYTRAGLPPTPIGNPGRDALSVIFRAERTDPAGEPYLYFLHGLDGSFRPNLTLEAHNSDVEAYLR